MKKIFSNVVLGICFLITGTLSAQKMAHVDVDSLLSMMPEYKEFTTKREAKLKELETLLAGLQKEYKEKYTYLETNYPTMSDIEKADKQAELAGFEQRIQTAQANAQQTYQAYEASLQKPIFEKVNKAIELVAKENGYKYVLSKAEGFVLYADPSDDITMLVKKKLDTMPAAKLPGSGAETGTGTQKPGGTGTGTGTQKPKPGGK